MAAACSPYTYTYTYTEVQTYLLFRQRPPHRLSLAAPAPSRLQQKASASIRIEIEARADPTQIVKISRYSGDVPLSRTRRQRDRFRLPAPNGESTARHCRRLSRRETGRVRSACSPSSGQTSAWTAADTDVFSTSTPYSYDLCACFFRRLAHSQWPVRVPVPELPVRALFRHAKAQVACRCRSSGGEPTST